MVRRIALAPVAVLLLPLVCIPGWIALNLRDLPDPDDADLMRRAEVAEEDDGYRAFREAAAAVDFPSGTEAHDRLTAHLRWEAFDPVWVEERLRSNTDAFAALERGLAAPAMQIPVFDAPDDDLVDVLLQTQILVRLSAVEARLRMREGDRARATERALLGMRVGRKLSEAADPNLVAMMVAATDQAIGLRAVEHLLRDARPSADEARDLAARLAADRWEPEAWERTWASEYRFIRDVVIGGFEEHGDDADALALALEDHAPPWLVRRLPSGFTFHPNRTLRDFAGIYRELGRRGHQDCVRATAGSTPDDSPGEGEPSSPGMLAMLLEPNSVGRMIVDLATPNFARFDLKRCHIETRIGLLQSLAALTAYEEQTGGLPDRLGDLVPRYLPAVPEDRFDGRPLRYAKAQRVVWSVGEDFEDDGPPQSPSQAEASEPAIWLGR